MTRSIRVLAINGSYRDDGITDQALAAAVDALQSAGADVDTVLLREQRIEFCLNCRACTQEPGDAPVGMITTGLIAQEADAKLPDKTMQRVKKLAARLA